MDSDSDDHDDGDRADYYDIPDPLRDDDAVHGFRINSSNKTRRVDNDDENDYDDDDDDDDHDDDHDRRRRSNAHPPSSSDDDDDDDDNGFAYGGGRRGGRKSKRSIDNDGKERGLYGSFLDDSSDDGGGGGRNRRRRPGGGAGGTGRTTTTTTTKSRHYDGERNRMAGLAFVRASNSSSSSSATGPRGVPDDNDDDDVGAGKEGPGNVVEVDGGDVPGKRRGNNEDRDGNDEAPLPGWLRNDASRARPTPDAAAVGEEEMKTSSSGGRQSNRTDREEDMEISDDDDENENDDDEDDREDDGTGRAPRDRMERFRDLLDVARTSSRVPPPPPPVVVDGTIAIGDGDGDDGIRRDVVVADDARAPAPSTTIDYDDDDDGRDDGVAGLGWGGTARPPPASRFHGTVGPRQSEDLSPPPWGGATTTTTTGGGLGLGIGVGVRVGLGFGGAGRPAAAAAARTRDPNLGKWERHTKGIGMRLLQKMGYEGSGGLGAKRRRAVGVPANVTNPLPSAAGEDGHAEEGHHSVKSETTTPAALDDDDKGGGVTIKRGISRPVEVVVRPIGLGLGYGNFKEQTQLKVNRRIEAEVRGVEPPVDEDKAGTRKAKRESSLYDGIDKSLLPSTDSLLNKGRGSWRRGERKPKRKIVNYQDIIDRSMAGDGSNKMKIIDMRGAANIVLRDDGDQNKADVPIGEELLHNVTLVLNTHEGQLRTTSYVIQSVERKIANVESECNEMEERKEAIRNRCDKMKLALDVAEEAEGLIDELTSKKSSDMSSNEKLDLVMNSLQQIFTKLYGNFSRDERTSLKFESTLIPSIVIPLLDTLTSSLSPLKLNTTWMDRLASGVKKLCDTVGSYDEACALREIIIIHGIVPWIQSSLISSKWDPVRNVEGGLGIYEALVDCANKSLQGAEREDNEILKESITGEVVQTAVLPKLLRAVSDWRPKFDNEHQIDYPLHLWILPWLPYINNDSMLGTLLDNVRRNLTKALSFLGKSVSKDVEFIRVCLATLSPWKKVFDDATIFQLTSDSVSPRFARSLARVEICIEPAEQDWEHLHVLFVYFERGVMSGNDFISLMEGEVLPAWAHALYHALQRPDHDMNAIKKFYTAWKGQIFDLPAQICEGSPSAHHVLRSDSLVCRYFFGGLTMIQAAIESNHSLLESLKPLHPSACNYRISLMHRSKERLAQNEKQQPSAIHVGARRMMGGHNRVEASFQEVVEAFANQHGIMFHPKSGSNSMIDGKPVFMFGEHPVYFDKNVLFTFRGSNWQPISLEHLAQAC